MTLSSDGVFRSEGRRGGAREAVDRRESSAGSRPLRLASKAEDLAPPSLGGQAGHRPEATEQRVRQRTTGRNTKLRLQAKVRDTTLPDGSAFRPAPRGTAGRAGGPATGPRSRPGFRSCAYLESYFPSYRTARSRSVGEVPNPLSEITRARSRLRDPTSPSCVGAGRLALRSRCSPT